MWPAAEVHELEVAVHAHLGAAGALGLVDALDDLDLERLVGEDLERLVLRHDVALEGLVLGDDLGHPRLDPLQVLGGEGPPDVEVVVEAVGDGRPDRERRSLEEVEHRLGHDVRGGVADDVAALLGVCGDDLE